ncbi:MAG: hypothetical protein NTY81_00020 [Candidatus Staskawiczbacteria bacterium]|nr:hypothetical protein [Candidatus Staskawiczbacteria bacterium]
MEITFVEIITLIMGVVSIVVGIVSLIFSWIFYQSGQKVNQDTRDILAKVSEKISKIDDIVSKQFDKMFSKAMGIDYEGEIPITSLRFSKKTKKNRKTKNNAK